VRFLLDTHLLLSWLGQSSLLSEEALDLIGDPEHQVLYSAVSLWEIRLKQSLGKLRIPENFTEALDTQSFGALPLRPEHTEKLASLPWHHRDPFDRMLVAQAQAEAIRLVTADEALAAYGKFVLVVNKGTAS
jgi:PIN domain nuclease of toxin-antitoxin system